MVNKKIFAILLLGVLTVSGIAIAQGGPENDMPAEPRGPPFREIDSRSFEVEEPCMADQVTIFKFKEIGQGSTCLEAEKYCRINLVLDIFNKADEECQNYKKIKNQPIECRASRGNLDPMADIDYGPCKYNKDLEMWEVECWNKNSIQYTCN